MRVPPDRNDFADFRDHIIKKARTRVLAFLNIVGAGMGTGKGKRSRRDGPGRRRSASRRRIPT